MFSIGITESIDKYILPEINTICIVKIKIAYMEELIMDGKIILLMISVVAVGMFVLPSTLALYSGSHDFVQGTEVDCGKCHSTSAGDEIAGTIANGSAHTGLTCKSCHYGDSGTVGGRFAVDVVGNGTGTDTTDAHAAGVSVNCIDCHSYPFSYQAATKDANGSSVNVSAEISMTGEAHKMLLVNTTGDNGGLADNDAVCIACHTRAVVSLAGSSLGTHNASSGIIYITNGTSTTEWMYSDAQ